MPRLLMPAALLGVLAGCGVAMYLLHGIVGLGILAVSAALGCVAYRLGGWRGIALAAAVHVALRMLAA